MSLWQHVSILLVSGIVLTAVARVAVRKATTIARELGLSGFVIGFFLLGVATSTPELFVAIQAASDGVPQLSMGNLLGGSILLLSFVMGVLSLLLGRVSLDHQLSMRELWVMMAVIASPVTVLWDGSLTRPDGLFLVGIYSLHAFLLRREGSLSTRRRAGLRRVEGIGAHLVVLAGAVIALFVSSRYIVTSAEAIIGALPIAPVVFGLFFLSLGTNLPELALAYESVRYRRREIAFGDFLGSSAANTLILGLLGLLAPFGGGDGGLTGALLLLGSVSLYFLWSVSSGGEMTRREGVGFLVFYFLFVAYELVA